MGMVPSCQLCNETVGPYGGCVSKECPIGLAYFCGQQEADRKIERWSGIYRDPLKAEDMREPTVVIMRGIPGSGKSHFAKEMAEFIDVDDADQYDSGLKCQIVSADDYFMTNGDYYFDPAEIGEAHKDCLRRFVASLRNLHHVIVDNTNISIAEIAPYYQLASLYTEDVTIKTVIYPWEHAICRSVHGVPPMQAYKMHLRMDEETRRMPPWWKHQLIFGGSADLDSRMLHGDT